MKSKESTPWLGVRAYVCGYWECVTTRPGYRFYPGTTRMVPAKRFKIDQLESAKKFAAAAGYKTFEVVRYDAPEPGRVEYNITQVFASDSAALM